MTLNLLLQNYVYGEPLRLPGEFFVPADDLSSDNTSFTTRLRSHIKTLSPTPAAWHVKKSFYLPADIFKSDFVFLRQGPAKTSMVSPYTGPHRVLERNLKTFKIDVKGKEITVTIDRLKPAYLVNCDATPAITKDVTPSMEPEATTTPERKTRSGRIVKFPDYYRP